QISDCNSRSNTKEAHRLAYGTLKSERRRGVVGCGMKLGFDSNVVATMSQFQLEQSSVIKTAPPGRQLEFSPK
ncbi:hypothetical protein TELCIR_24801, partial [Teladorsagia circumcincta]